LAQEVGTMNRLICLSLEATSPTVKAGEIPTFRLTIRNEGASPERIIDLTGGRRPDLQDSIYDLEVTQGGTAVDIPRVISDPGPIVENDFLELKPGGKVSFELTRFPSMLGMLAAGSYQARVRFWRVPYEPGQTFVYSSYAEFTIYDDHI
jgi:hypothetical protein